MIKKLLLLSILLSGLSGCVSTGYHTPYNNSALAQFYRSKYQVQYVEDDTPVPPCTKQNIIPPQEDKLASWERVK